MEKFSLWLERKEDMWAFLMNILESPEDEFRVLMLADYLEENGYIETVKLIRNRVTGEPKVAYWDTMEAELKNHGIVLGDKLVKVNGETLSIDLDKVYILNKETNRWEPLAEPRPEAVPGLIAIFLGGIQKTANEYKDKIVNSHFGNYVNEFRNIYISLRSLDYTAMLTRHRSGPIIYRLRSLVDKTNKLLDRVKNRRNDTLWIMQGSLEHILESIERVLLNNDVNIQAVGKLLTRIRSTSRGNT